MNHCPLSFMFKNSVGRQPRQTIEKFVSSTPNQHRVPNPPTHHRVPNPPTHPTPNYPNVPSHNVKKRAAVEGFDGNISQNGNKIECSKDVASDNTASTTKNFYSEQRTNNIQQLRAKYNSALTDYLNQYNDYQVAEATNSTSDMSTLQKSLDASKKQLEQIKSALVDNNNKTSELIKNNQEALENKGKLIDEKNKRIEEQQKIIQERNEVLNSRKRQIEMGLEKNIYKRNLMYFLIFVNIIVILVLVSLIMRSS